MRKKITSLLILLLVLGGTFLPFPKKERVSSQQECQHIPVGNIAKRALEIRDELLFNYTLIEQKGSQLIALANEVKVMLKDECPPVGCIPPDDGCENVECHAEWGLLTGWKVKCPLGKACQSPPGGGDLCPPEIQDLLKDKIKKMKIIRKELENLFGKSLVLMAELSVLKNELNASENNLKNVKPDEELFSCFEAESLGFRENPSIFGIPLGTRKIHCQDIRDPLSGTILKRRDGLDYYICPKP